MKKRIFLIVLLIGICFLNADLCAWSFWETAGRITWTPGSSKNQDIAIDSNNNLYLVWQDDSPGHFEIFFKRSTDGGYNWTGAQRLTWSSGGFVNPDIAIDSNNRIYVVMKVPYGKICYKKSTDGGESWSSPQTIAWVGGWAPAIAIDSNNMIHVVWAEDGAAGAGWIVYKKSTDYGITWPSPKKIFWKPEGKDYFQHVSIHIASNNTLHVVALYGYEGTDFYYKNSTDGGNTWPMTQRLTWPTHRRYTHVLTSDSSNTIHFFWGQPYDGNNFRAFYKKSTNDGASWSTTQNLTWAGTSGVADVAIESNNNIHVILGHIPPSGDYVELYYRKSTDVGTTWTPMQRITWRHPGETHDCGTTRMAVDSNDDIHVVWWRDGDFYYGKMK